MVEYEDYIAKLQDPRWQKIRLKIFERDNFSCRWCGNSKELLHAHRVYSSNQNPWEDDPENIITLCKTCKDDNKNRLYYEQDLLNRMLQLPPSLMEPIAYILKTLYKESGFPIETAMDILLQTISIEGFDFIFDKFKHSTILKGKVLKDK